MKISGAPNGTGRGPYDRWFRYAAGFNQQVLARCYEVLRLPPHVLVADPFAGAGSTGTFLISLGHDFVGIEAHPSMAELANLKLKGPPSRARIESAAETVLKAPASVDLTSEHPLVLRSFHDQALRDLVGLRDAIQATKTIARPYLKWALLGALRECASVNVGWPYQRPAVPRKPRFTQPRRAFARRVAWMCDDLELPQQRVRGRVVRGDSRDISVWQRALADRSPAAILTSPPYLNNFDYADATRLELFFWRVASSWSEMVRRVRSGMIVATTQQSSVGLAGTGAQQLRRAAPVSAGTIEALTARLESERKARRRGKEYDRLLPAYFSDMALVLKAMASACDPGTPVILVVGDSAPYGVYVDTPSILIQIAGELGFSPILTETVRRRGSRWASNGSRHQLPLREELILLHGPC